MEKTPIEIPTLGHEDFSRLLPSSLIYPGLSELFGHYSKHYLKQIISKMNGYTWFRFIEAESKSLIFKKMATRVLYRMLHREPVLNICAGNENGYLWGERAVAMTSRGVNYKVINEDGVGIYEDADELVMVICDGVGDCLVGEVASFVILEEFRKNLAAPPAGIYSRSVERLTKLGEDLVNEVPEFMTFPNEVSQAAVTAVKIKGDSCEIHQVGDVIFYHVREGELRLLDQEGRWLDMEQLKHLFADESYLSQRHIISNAVGRNYNSDWLPTHLTLKKDDIVILASDGLETLHPQEVQDVINSEAGLEEKLRKLYQDCIDANLQWNTPNAPIYTKPDNISIALYRH